MSADITRPQGDSQLTIPEEAIEAEALRVVRQFQHYTSEQRANLRSSHRAGHRQRTSLGSYFYTHPDVPHLAFPTRGRAAEAGARACREPAAVDLDVAEFGGGS